MLTRVSKLADKAMLVKLTVRRASLTRRDTALTAKLQQQEGDASLSVLSTLFKDKASPVYTIMTKLNEVYAYHKERTLPYVDAGPRILPNAMYFEYTQEMKHRIAVVDKMLDTYMPLYDQLVQDDLAYRRQVAQATGKVCTATADDYPSAEKFRASTAVDIRFQPMPDSRHFLFDLNEEDIAACEQAEAEAQAAARTETIQRMLKPLSALVTRLSEYQGNKGERWHNAIIQNVIDGCKLARQLAIDPPTELLTEIDNLEQAAKGYLATVEVIKGSANARADAKRKLEEVAAKMAAFTA
jgi:hypothetical protein